MQLNLTRFQLETVEVDSRDAAAEVVACVRNDGMEMSEVAEESRYPFHRSEVLLEDIPLRTAATILECKGWNTVRSHSARRRLRSLAGENANRTVLAGPGYSRAPGKPNCRPLFQ
jgi:hypothetical protein